MDRAEWTPDDVLGEADDFMQQGESREQTYARLTKGMKRADVLLLLIEQHCTTYPGAYWRPSAYDTVLHVGRETAWVTIGGPGDAAIFRSLERKGLIEPPVATQFDHPSPYSYFITESGKLRAQELL